MGARVQGAVWGEPGGIVALAGLMDEHRGAFEYDWRTRFRLPLSAVGRSMPWGEAWRLTQILAGDSSSLVASTLAGWPHPFSQTDRILADLFDLQHRSKARKRPDPYPRPWAEGNRKRLGRSSLPPMTAREALRRAAR